MPEFAFVSILAKCGNSNCDSHVELIALRDRGTSEEMIYGEIPTWKVLGILCAQGHPIASPVQIWGDVN